MLRRDNANVGSVGFTMTEEETKEEEYDFDFSAYEQEEDDSDKEVEAAVLKKAPAVQIYRSRWSNATGEYERLTGLNIACSKYGVLVSSRDNKMRNLYRFYGILDEIWSIIKPIQGGLVITKTERIKKILLRALRECENKESIPEYLFLYILYFRDHVYKMKQFTNMGIEVTKTNKGIYSKAKSKILG